jgi:hypothetical protein
MGSFYGTITPGTVVNADLADAAAITATKLQHQYSPVFAQANSDAESDTGRVLHVVKGATGTIVAFRAGSIVAATGNATVTIDLKNNGTSVLSGVITLDSNNTAYVVEEGTIAIPAVAAGDVLTLVIVATAGTGTLPTGLFAQAVIREDA